VKPVLIHREAEVEIEAGSDYYESRRPGLGSDFRAEIESKIWSIRGDPLRWPVFKPTGARRCRLKRFPYNVVYYDTADEIWIVAVAHQKRKPGYWTERKPGD
jgi:hypothetical protein